MFFSWRLVFLKDAFEFFDGSMSCGFLLYSGGDVEAGMFSFGVGVECRVGEV